MEFFFLIGCHSLVYSFFEKQGFDILLEPVLMKGFSEVQFTFELDLFFVF